MSDAVSDRDQLRTLALERLGVRAEDVARQPRITPQLRMIAATVRRAGQPRVTRRIGTVGAVTVAEDTRHAVPHGPGADLYRAWPLYLEASESDDARMVMVAYRSIPRHLARTLDIEAFCLAGGVSPVRILEILVGVAVRFGAQASTIIAAVNHPRVVEKTVEMALTDGGVDDRTTLHKATGFLPAPKGAHTNITIAQNASATATGGNAQAAVVAPPPEQTIRRLVDRFNDARLLPAPVTPALEARETLPDVVEATEELVEIGDEDSD